MTLVINSITLILTGLIFLRIFGRRSISQMTIGQTVLMISIGSLIVSPIGNESVVKTVIAAGIIVLTIIVLEFAQMKSTTLERILTGKSVVLIDEGEIQTENLNRMRMTLSQLKVRLRQKGVGNIKDVKTATIESNGEVGFELKDDAKPITFKEVKQLLVRLGYNIDITESKSGDIFNDARRESNEEEI